VIPTLSLPVSLIGAVALLWGLNYSLDNISLLGLTLAVGLVVDDAIVMLENIMRHVEDGVPPFQAALARFARGGLHHHFDLHLADRGVHPDLFHARGDRPAVPRVCGGGGLAILVSAFVSLTLVPMLASRFLSDEAHGKRPGLLASVFEAGFNALLKAYERTLDSAWLTASRC
jgi:HAE1 family hydrophobic/amphiphilic exporter-1